MKESTIKKAGSGLLGKLFEKIKERISALFRGGFFHVFTGTFLNKAVTMISSIVVARFVDKDQYAYLGYADTVYGYLALFTGLGMASAMLKVCAGQTSKENDRAYLGYAIRWTLAFSLIVTTITVAVMCLIQLPFEGAKHFLIVMALYPAFYCVYDLLITYVRSKSYVKQYAYLNLLYSILTCALSILFVLCFDAIGIVFARYIVLAVLALILFKYVHGIFLGTEKESLHPELKRNFWKISLTLVVANAFSVMMPYNENMLISHIIAETEVLSNYRVANYLPQMILLVSQAVVVYFFPIIAAMDNEGKSIQRFVIRVGLLNFGLVVFCAAVGMALTPIVLPLMYGSKYADAIHISMFLWIMRGLNAGIRIVPMNMLIAVGQYRFNLCMSVITSFAQIIVDWYFISKMGVYGVFAGTVIIYLIIGVVYWARFIRVSAVRGSAE